MANQLTVIAGPTAVGKGTVVKYILEHFENFHLSVSATTRAPRPGEIEGVSYFFLTPDQFDELVSSGEMLEYAVVHGLHKYGTPRKAVEAALARGENVILEIDIQGARQVKSAMPEARTIFIAPPNWDELVRRLESRGTESPSDQSKRLETAREELAAKEEFDFVVVNDEVARCASRVVELIQS